MASLGSYDDAWLRLGPTKPFALTSPTKDELLLGAERARRAYPYRSLIEAGGSRFV